MLRLKDVLRIRFTLEMVDSNLSRQQRERFADTSVGNVVLVDSGATGPALRPPHNRTRRFHGVAKLPGAWVCGGDILSMAVFVEENREQQLHRLCREVIASKLHGIPAFAHRLEEV